MKRTKNPFYLPLEYFHGHSEIRELIRWTLDPERVAKRGWFDPGFVRWPVERMETGELRYLKQVVSLVILELWYSIFIDRQRLW